MTRSALKTGAVGLGLRRAFIERVAQDPPPDIDFYEIHPENYIDRGGAAQRAFEKVAAQCPILAHGLTLSVGGTDPLDFGYLQKLREFLRRFQIPWMSDHLCFTSHRGQQFHDLIPLSFSAAAAHHVAERARVIQDFLEVPLALENVSYYLSPEQPEMDEAAFLKEVLDRSGTALLLDLNNVYVNTANHGGNAHEFLRRLASERILWLHVAGHHRRSPSLIIDTHGAAVPAPVWELLRNFGELRPLPPVLIERDNNIPADIAELLAEVKQAKLIVAQGAATIAKAAPRTAVQPTISLPDRGNTGPAVGNAHLPRSNVSPCAPSTATPPGSLAQMSRLIHDPQDTSLSAHLRRQGEERLTIYRTLILNNLRGVVENALPLFCRFLGGSTFSKWLADFLAAGATRSRFYRHIPSEFVDYLVRTHDNHPLPLPFLMDLARHEVAVFDLVAAPDPLSLPAHALTQRLDAARPVFNPVLRLMTHAYAVLNLTPDTLPETVAHHPTPCAVVRDPEFLRVNTVPLEVEEFRLCETFASQPQTTVAQGFANTVLNPHAVLKKWLEDKIVVALV